MMKRLLCLFAGILLVLTACAGQPFNGLAPTPTPRLATQSGPVIDDLACAPAGADALTRHSVTATVDYVARSVQVEQGVRWVNRTGSPIDEIVLLTEPNREPGVFTFDTVTLDDGSLPAYDLTGRRLAITLPAPLQAGCAVNFTLRFALAVPPVRSGVNGYRGFFGYTDRQFNLGNWLPVVAARRDGAWVTHEVSFIGEQIAADTADWNVRLYVQNAPAGLLVAAPGQVSVQPDGWTITHTASRDLAISLSDQFVVQTRMAGEVTVELYTFSDTVVQTDAGIVDGAPVALDAAADSLALYADLFGAYPYDRFVVVEGDFPDGMEFSDLVFVSRDWFRTYNGTPQSYLVIITVHEVAHQWWFARVGNDQALTPWLDEALATYSEYVYYEEFHPDLREWWWAFRVDAFAPAGYTAAGQVDSSVYAFGTIREYINAVYLRGARMLHELRAALGTEAFFAWLRSYAAAGEGRLVTPDVIWSLLTPDQWAQTGDIRSRYLSAADVRP